MFINRFRKHIRMQRMLVFDWAYPLTGMMFTVLTVGWIPVFMAVALYKTFRSNKVGPISENITWLQMALREEKLEQTWYWSKAWKLHRDVDVSFLARTMASLIDKSAEWQPLNYYKKAKTFSQNLWEPPFSDWVDSKWASNKLMIFLYHRTQAILRYWK